MAKRVRSRSSRRPGGQGPSRKTTSGPAVQDGPEVSAVPAQDTDAVLESTDVASDEVAVDEAAAAYVASTAAPVAAPGESKRRRRARRRAKTRPDDLAARATAESVWVRADLRRIGVISVIMLVALAVAWVVFVALDILSLY